MSTVAGGGSDDKKWKGKQVDASPPSTNQDGYDETKLKSNKRKELGKKELVEPPKKTRGGKCSPLAPPCRFIYPFLRCAVPKSNVGGGHNHDGDKAEKGSDSKTEKGGDH